MECRAVAALAVGTAGHLATLFPARAIV